MSTHQFGGQVPGGWIMDPQTRVKLRIRIFGEIQCDCDEERGRFINHVICQVVGRVAGDSPTPVKLCRDPTAFPTVFEPAIQEALQKSGMPPVRFGSFNMSFAPETIEELEALAAKAKGAQAPAQAPAPLTVGATVLVQWADGNRYPGTVQAMANGQYQVGFANGQTYWIPAAYVSAAPK